MVTQKTSYVNIIFSSVIVITFLYSQFIWAAGIPEVTPINSLKTEKPQKNLPSAVQETSPKVFSTNSTLILAQAQIPVQTTPKNQLLYKYEYGGNGYSSKMQGYIDEINRQIEVAEAEMRDA